MADSDSSSETSTSGSDLILILRDLLTEEVFETFTGIQPWCFEPPG